MDSIMGRGRHVRIVGSGPFRSLVLAASLVAAGCGTSTPPGFDESSAPPDVRESMAAALRQCTIDYGYNPDQAGSLGPTQLGAGELDWRDCAYDALERVVEPNLQQPEALEALIEDDERLTEGIEDGTSTRAERAAVLQARLNDMQARELQLYQQNAANLGAAQALDAATSDTEYQRIRNDIASIGRMF